MELLQLEFINACERQSDIHQHLPLLYKLSNSVNHVTEFGVRDGQSTRALLASTAAVRSYDLYIDFNLEKIFEYAKQNGRDVKYIQGNSLKIDIEPTDLLFIDTDHKYSQVKAELDRHHSKVNKYIAFHDTWIYGCNDEENKGLLAAILEFLIEHKEWTVMYHTTENNGFTVLEKTVA